MATNQNDPALEAEMAKQAGMGAPQSLNAEAAQQQALETPEQTMARLKGDAKLQAERAAIPGIYGGANPPQTPLPELPKEETIKPPPSVPTAQQITQNTYPQQQQEQKNSTSAQTILNNLPPGLTDEMFQSFGETESGKSAEQAIKDREQALKDLRAGQYSEAQQAQIKAAEEQARSLYEPLIKEAEYAKEEGLPKALVAAGERGGFMNTQFAGAAALLPTKGGSFVGAGGELERIKSSYDRNIAQAKNALNQAVAAARASAIQAIETGEQGDLQQAQQDYERARSAHNEGIQLAQQKANAVMQWQQQQEELDLARKKAKNESITKSIDVMAKSGVDPNSIPDWYFDQLDAEAGYLGGTSAAMFQIGYDEHTQKEFENDQSRQEFALKQFSAIQGVLDKIPLGESITIDGNEYFGRSRDGIEIDADGNGYRFITDSDGNIVKQNLGFIGNKDQNWDLKVDDNGTAWKFNSRTGEIIPVSNNIGGSSGGAGVVQDAGAIWGELLPEGSFFGGDEFIDPATGRPFTPEKQGQCGVFVRWATNGGIRMGNSFEEKKALVDKTIGTPENPVQVGDAFVQKTNGWTGHTGIVNSVFTAPDGTDYVRVTESNWGSDGKITHSRTMPVSQLAGFIRPPQGVRSELQTGSDTVVNGQQSGPYFKPKSSDTSSGTPEGEAGDQLINDYAFAYLGGDSISSIPTANRNDVIARASEIKTQFKDTPQLRAFKMLTGNLGKSERQAIEASIYQSLLDGNADQASAEIKSAIRASATADEKRVLEARDQLSTQLSQLGPLFDQYVAAGGKTSILSGSEESIAKKLGAQKDPVLRSLGTRITSILIDFRKQYSGAAFTDKESQQYESLLPSIGNLPQVNKGIINTMVSQFNQANTDYYKRRIGEENYNELFPTLSKGEQSLYSDAQANLVKNILTLPSGQPRKNSQGQQITQQEADDIARQIVEYGYINNDPDQIAQIINNALGFNNALSTAQKGSKKPTQNVSLGELSAKYESNGKPGTIGYDKSGGYSYGTYQIAKGNVGSFVNQSPYASEFSGLKPDSAAFMEKWKQIASRDPKGFEDAQHAYIERQFYKPQVSKLAASGFNIDRYSDVLKDVIWSTAVQHGPNTNVVLNVIKKLGKNASESNIIKKIYDERWSNGDRFASSSPGVKKSIYNRYFARDGELNLALSRLKFKA